jgi:hypothetical protein
LLHVTGSTAHTRAGFFDEIIDVFSAHINKPFQICNQTRIRGNAPVIKVRVDPTRFVRSVNEQPDRFVAGWHTFIQLTGPELHWGGDTRQRRFSKGESQAWAAGAR